MGDKEFQELLEEVDEKKTGFTNYDAILSALFLTVMYIK